MLSLQAVTSARRYPGTALIVVALLLVCELLTRGAVSEVEVRIRRVMCGLMAWTHHTHVILHVRSNSIQVPRFTANQQTDR